MEVDAALCVPQRDHEVRAAIVRGGAGGPGGHALHLPQPDLPFLDEVRDGLRVVWHSERC